MGNRVRVFVKLWVFACVCGSISVCVCGSMGVFVSGSMCVCYFLFVNV